jgi:hypothetical protein
VRGGAGRRAADRLPGIDYAGVGLLSAGAIAILITLDLVSAAGLTSPVILALLAGGLALLAVFLLAERRLGGRALVPAVVLRTRVFSASCGAVLLMSAIFFSALLYLPQFMQVVLHFSAIRAGAGLLPMMGVFAVTSFVAGSLYGRLGPRLTVSAGAALMAAGIFLLSFPASGSAYLALVPGMCVLGVGVGLFYSAVTHRRGHRARPGPVQPGRRHRLHVPDRRASDRAGPEHRDRAQRGHAAPRDHGRLPGRRRTGGGRLHGRARVRARPAVVGRARGGPGSASPGPGLVRNCHYVRPWVAGRRATIGGQTLVVPAIWNEET